MNNILFKIKSQFISLGYVLHFCFSCQKVVNYDINIPEIICECGVQICTICEFSAHKGTSCYPNFSLSNFEKIRLVPPANLLNPTSFLEKEYIRVRNAFNSSVSANLEFSEPYLIINKDTENRYENKKNGIAEECKGMDKINEGYFWHGSLEPLQEKIVSEGFKVGGVDGIPIRSGKSYGYGVYTAIGVSTPISSSSNFPQIIYCAAIKGNNSPVGINSIDQLNNKQTHSFTSGDIVVFFTKD